jgi:hypothetical protein
MDTSEIKPGPALWQTGDLSPEQSHFDIRRNKTSNACIM